MINSCSSCSKNENATFKVSGSRNSLINENGYDFEWTCMIEKIKSYSWLKH